MYGLHVLAFLLLFSTDSNQHLLKLPSISGNRINSVREKTGLHYLTSRQKFIIYQTSAANKNNEHAFHIHNAMLFPVLGMILTSTVMTAAPVPCQFSPFCKQF